MGIFDKKDKSNAQDISGSSMLLSGTKFTGNIVSESPVRIDGQFDGDVSCARHVVIGQEALIKGTLSAKEIEVYGRVEGKLHAHNVNLKAGCKVTGDIACTHLYSEQEAFFDGKCRTAASETDKIKTENNNEVEGNNHQG